MAGAVCGTLAGAGEYLCSARSIPTVVSKVRSCQAQGSTIPWAGMWEEEVLGRVNTGKDQKRPVHGYSLVLSTELELINHFDKIIKACICCDL